MATDIRQKLVSYIKDAHAMERNTLQMLEAMIATTDDEKIGDILRHHRDETKVQIERLEDCLDAHDENTSTVKDVAGVMGALFKGMGDAIRSDKAGKNARDGFVTESLEIAAYELLERLALRANDQATAQVARQNRSEEIAMRDKIEANWDRFLDLMLEEEEISV